MRGVNFFKPKILITQRNLNQNRKYFNPLVSGPGGIRIMKKNGGQKSRWTVPVYLNSVLLGMPVPRLSKITDGEQSQSATSSGNNNNNSNKNKIKR